MVEGEGEDACGGVGTADVHVEGASEDNDGTGGNPTGVFCKTSAAFLRRMASMTRFSSLLTLRTRRRKGSVLF